MASSHSASQGPIRRRPAIEEKGDIGKVFLVGPLSSPGPGTQASSRKARSWAWVHVEIRPKPGRVFVRVGKMEANGKEIKDGDTIEGLGVRPSPIRRARNIITNNLLQINKDTVDKLADLGL